MNWYLGNYWYLFLLLLLPLFGILMYQFKAWKNKRKNIFAESRFQNDLFPKKSGFSKLLPVLYILAGFFLIVAIVDILSGTEEIKSKQKISNVIFLLDVSNSMNAQDIEPNRLTEAKNIMTQTLAKLQNDKVGIIVFAGDATSIMPLTTDYSAAATYIAGIETSIMPTQGTDFLRAVKTAAEKFKNVPKGARRIVLISDGEDNEGNAEEALKLAKKEGISLLTVGVGTEAGAPVPEYIFGQLMGYKVTTDGETVISKRETAALKDLAEKTGTEYVDGNDLETSTDQIITALQKTASTSSIDVSSQTAVHYYQYPLGIAFVLFFIILIFNPKRNFDL